MSTDIKVSTLARQIAENVLGEFVRAGWLKESDINAAALLVQSLLESDKASRELDALKEKER